MIGTTPLLTRRTFLQSSVAASVATAAHASGHSWLLNEANPVRVAFLGLDGNTANHLELLANIPNAQVVALSDSNPKRLRDASRLLTDLGGQLPIMHADPDKLLADRSIQGIAVGSEIASTPRMFLRTLGCGVPLLVDEVPRELNLQAGLQIIQGRSPAIVQRANECVYPSSPQDLVQSLRRVGTVRTTAVLRLSSTSVAARRAPLIATLNMLLHTSNLSTMETANWLGGHSLHRGHADDARLSASIPLPPNKFGLFALLINSLTVPLADHSTLVLTSRQGSVEIQVADEPREAASVISTLNFLASCRGKLSDADNQSARSLLAAAMADIYR